MKIAVACIGTEVSEHFGHCETFCIFETEQNNIQSEQIVQNPGHQPKFLPNFLGEMGVGVVISGGMGGGAMQLFQEKNISVITGARGNARMAVERYLAGELQSAGVTCHRHEHADTCGGHHHSHGGCGGIIMVVAAAGIIMNHNVFIVKYWGIFSARKMPYFHTSSFPKIQTFPYIFYIP